MEGVKAENTEQESWSSGARETLIEFPHRESLGRAAELFGIGQVQSISPAANGISNSSYFVGTDRGEYVLRLLKTQTLAGLKNEVSIERQLEYVGVVTPQLLAGPDSTYYVEANGNLLTCSERIAGRHPESSTPELAEKIGTVLAKYHAGVRELPEPGNSWFRQDRVERELMQLRDDDFGSLLRTRFHDSVGILTAKLPEGYIHGDLHFWNLLVTEAGNIAVLDFEEASRNILLFDLAISALSLYDFGYDAGDELLGALFRGYEAQRTLTPPEHESFSQAVLYASTVSASWLYNQGHIDYAHGALRNADRVITLNPLRK